MLKSPRKIYITNFSSSDSAESLALRRGPQNRLTTRPTNKNPPISRRVGFLITNAVNLLRGYDLKQATKKPNPHNDQHENRNARKRQAHQTKYPFFVCHNQVRYLNNSYSKPMHNCAQRYLPAFEATHVCANPAF